MTNTSHYLPMTERSSVSWEVYWISSFSSKNEKKRDKCRTYRFLFIQYKVAVGIQLISAHFHSLISLKPQHATKEVIHINLLSSFDIFSDMVCIAIYGAGPCVLFNSVCFDFCKVELCRSQIYPQNQFGRSFVYKSNKRYDMTRK